MATYGSVGQRLSKIVDEAWTCIRGSRPQNPALSCQLYCEAFGRPSKIRIKTCKDHKDLKVLVESLGFPQVVGGFAWIKQVWDA